mgnify:CR=1 FL=1
MRIIKAILLAAGLFAVIVTFTPLVSWWAGRLAGPWYSPQGDVLILPGADVMEPGILGYSSYLRCYYALLAWREHPYRRVLVLGKGVSGPMRLFLTANGMPAGAIVTDDESTSTFENAQQARRLLAGETGRLILMSSDYHMRRAAAVFRKQGLEVVPVPVPDAIKRAGRLTQRWDLFFVLATETAKILWYRVKGFC